MDFLALPDEILQPVPHSKLVVTILEGSVLRVPAFCSLRVRGCQHAHPTPCQGSTADLHSPASTSHGSHLCLSTENTFVTVKQHTPHSNSIINLCITKNHLKSQIFFSSLKTAVWHHHWRHQNIHLDSYFCHKVGNFWTVICTHWKMSFSKSRKIKIKIVLR